MESVLFQEDIIPNLIQNCVEEGRCVHEIEDLEVSSFQYTTEKDSTMEPYSIPDTKVEEEDLWFTFSTASVKYSSRIGSIIRDRNAGLDIKTWNLILLTKRSFRAAIASSVSPMTA